MKRYAQILYGKAHWIFESDETPDFAPDIVIVDISNSTGVQEGWEYNSDNGVFIAPVTPPYEPVDPRPSSEEVRALTILNTEYLVIMSGMSNL